MAIVPIAARTPAADAAIRRNYREIIESIVQ